IDAIHLHREPLQGKRVAIVGAGAAGLTAATRARSYRAEVTIFERGPELVGVQKTAGHRWLHPTIYDWPFSAVDATDNAARLPVMDWEAMNADLLSQEISKKALVAEKRSGGSLSIHRSTNVTRVEQNPSGGITCSTESSSTGPRKFDFEACIVAVGFALQPYNQQHNSYWEGDAIDNTGRGLGVLIVGYGDGALTDLMRACVVNFRHERFLKEVIKRAGRDRALDTIRAIELHPRSNSDIWLTEHY